MLCILQSAVAKESSFPIHLEEWILYCAYAENVFLHGVVFGYSYHNDLRCYTHLHTNQPFKNNILKKSGQKEY